MPCWDLQHLAWLVLSILQFLEGNFAGTPNLERRPDHNNGNYLPYSLQEICWFFMSLLLTSTEKMQETGPMVYHPYLRRLRFLSICGCCTKDRSFFSVISRPWMLRSGVWTVNLPHTVQHSTTWATQSVVSSGSSFQAQFLMQMLIPIYLKTINNKLKKKKLQLAIWLLIIGCIMLSPQHILSSRFFVYQQWQSRL